MRERWRRAAILRAFIFSDDRDRMLAYRDLAALDKLRSMSKQGDSPYCEYSGRWRERWRRAAILGAFMFGDVCWRSHARPIGNVLL